MSVVKHAIVLTVLASVVTASVPALAQENRYRGVFLATPPESDPAETKEPHAERHPGDDWLLAGILFLTIPYGLSLTGAVGSTFIGHTSHEDWLALPGVGPVPLIVETSNPVGNVVLSLDALAQLGGIAMIVYGGVLRSTRSHEARAPLPVTLAPLLGSGRSGVVVVGEF